MVETIITALIASAGANGIFIFILKKRIEHEYAQKLATHTAKLSRDNEFEIASFKHKLELAAADKTFRFSHVFERTAETIAAIYLKLTEFCDAVSELQYTASRPQVINETLLEKAREKREAVQNYFSKNKIYIPKTTAKRIMDFYTVQYATTVAFTTGKTMQGTASAEERYKDLFELNKQTPILLGLLEDDFQKLLGFPIDEQLS